MNHRKLPFSRVVENLRRGAYRGKIQSTDYANTGIQPFDEMKFAMQLGISKGFLRQIGLVKIKDVSGWCLPAEPRCEELESCRTAIEAEIDRVHAAWLEWKASVK